ncbi:MAG: 50S ribosomal protein L22 [Actinobacteria bacterium]|nr:50S ribosomal protein L22 [Actinomycetota bacterium]
MEVKANAKHIRMSPRKIRLVVDAVRGMEVGKALDQLRFIKKLAAKPVAKLVNSAIANAVNNFELDKDNLYIKEIKVDDGATAHRWMPRAYGRATPIRKRTSHISLMLAEVKDSGVKGPKKQEIEAPIKLGSEEVKKAKKQESKKIEKQENNKVIKQESKIDEKAVSAESEQVKKIVDPRMEGRGGHTKVEGKSHKGFTDKIFRRKSG